MTFADHLALIVYETAACQCEETPAAGKQWGRQAAAGGPPSGLWLKDRFLAVMRMANHGDGSSSKTRPGQLPCQWDQSYDSIEILFPVCMHVNMPRSCSSMNITSHPESPRESLQQSRIGTLGQSACAWDRLLQGSLAAKTRGACRWIGI